MTPPLAFIDTETTGIHPTRRPWEIAIIRREPDGTETTVVIQIIDVDLAQADPFGLRVGRFYERHTEYARDTVDELSSDTAYLLEATAAPIVERLTRGAHIIGAVPNFDTETLDHMLRRHQLLPAWHYHLIDVENLAVGYLRGRAHFMGNTDLPWKSDEISRACGVEPPSEQDRHTALGDAQWAQRLYDAITGHQAPESPTGRPEASAHSGEAPQ